VCKVGDKGSDVLLTVFFKNDLVRKKKKVFRLRNSFPSQPKPSKCRKGWKPRAKRTLLPHWLCFSPRRRGLFVLHTHRRKGRSPPPPASLSLSHTHTHTHTHTQLWPSTPHFMFSAALVCLTPGNTHVSCWLSAVTWGFFLKGSFIISLMSPAFRL
jgi:hypothetical protein